MRQLEQFARFLWDFVIGDDWRIALAVAVALVVTLILADNGAGTWWILPTVVGAILAISVWTVARNQR